MVPCRDMEGYGGIWSVGTVALLPQLSFLTLNPTSIQNHLPTLALSELNKIHNKLPLSLPLRRLSINSTAASWAASLLSSNATYESRYGLGSNRR